MGIKGPRITERRTDLKISQQELADRLTMLAQKKISQQVVALAERKEDSNPAFSAWLPDALNTTREYLTGRTSDPTPDDSGPKPSQTGLSGTSRQIREGGMEMGDIYVRIGELKARIEALEGRRARRGPAIKKDGRGPQHGRRTS